MATLDSNLLMDRFFPDMDLLRTSFRNIPLGKRPTISVYCSTSEYPKAQMLAPNDFPVNFIMTDNYPNQQSLIEEQNRKRDKRDKRELMAGIGERVVDYIGVAVGLTGIGSSFNRLFSSNEIDVASIFMGFGGALLIAETISGKVYERLKKDK